MKGCDYVVKEFNCVGTQSWLEDNYAQENINIAFPCSVSISIRVTKCSKFKVRIIILIGFCKISWQKFQLYSN